MKCKIYCPWSGCGMPNVASEPCPVICGNCGYGTHQKPYTLTSFDKVCKQCKHCISCGRISKKEYLK